MPFVPTVPTPPGAPWLRRQLSVQELPPPPPPPAPADAPPEACVPLSPGPPARFPFPPAPPPPPFAPQGDEVPLALPPGVPSAPSLPSEPSPAINVHPRNNTGPVLPRTLAPYELSPGIVAADELIVTS